MLIELAMFIGGAAYFSGVARTVYSDAQEAKKSIAAIPKTFVPENPTVLLVVELLRADEGWGEIKEPRASYTNYETWHHETGVRIRLTDVYDGIMDYSSTSVLIQTDYGTFETAEITSNDGKAIRKELEAFKSRQRDSKQRELTRLLATRVQARERGEILPILGSPELSQSESSDGDLLESERKLGETDATGLLTYDKVAQQIVKVGGGNHRLVLSDALKARYNIARPQTQKVYL